MTIDSVEIAGSPANKLILTLTEANELGFEIESIEGLFRGVNADSLASGRDLVDSNKYNLIFENGVPVSLNADGALPVLKFKGTYSTAEGITRAELAADYAADLDFSGPTLTIND